ncbi:MAG: Bacterial inner membrane protein [Bacteroidetes bacterium HLUCCA01]|nr:MAG: Bacterial inner membrane protein [Bacteroidetes bacterium HLUCCA01]
METNFFYEIIGYTASVLVAVSLMMSKVLTLRLVNMIGAATFSLYGYLIGSIPVAGMNGFIVLINLYYLVQMYRSKTFFSLLEVAVDDKYLQHFLAFYEKDMRKTQSGFKKTPEADSITLFVLSNMVPAGLLVGHRSGEGVLTVDIDYAIPQYRDFKIGRFLFMKKASWFTDKGIQEIRAYADRSEHRQYLSEMGFEADHRENWFVKKLPG